MRRSMNLARHLPIVCLIIFSRTASALFGTPAALANARRARLLSAPGSDRLRANDRSCARSCSLSTKSAFAPARSHRRISIPKIPQWHA
jgi:hypothetical protein